MKGCLFRRLFEHKLLFNSCCGVWTLRLGFVALASEFLNYCIHRSKKVFMRMIFLGYAQIRLLSLIQVSDCPARVSPQTPKIFVVYNSQFPLSTLRVQRRRDYMRPYDPLSTVPVISVRSLTIVR